MKILGCTINQLINTDVKVNSLECEMPTEQNHCESTSSNYNCVKKDLNDILDFFIIDDIEESDLNISVNNFSDVTQACEDEKNIEVHKVILSPSNPSKDCQLSQLKSVKTVPFPVERNHYVSVKLSSDKKYSLTKYISPVVFRRNLLHPPVLRIKKSPKKSKKN